MEELRREYTVTDCCEALDLPRSTFYYQPQAKDDSAERSAIQDIAERFPKYGKRRVHEQLLRPPYAMIVGLARVRRLMVEMGLEAQSAGRAPATTDSRHSQPRYPNLVRGMKTSRPDQLWVADITYIRHGSGHFYLAVIMDVHTRSLRGWCLSRSLGQELTLSALREALREHDAPEIHHSDQGGQYAAAAYVRLLRDAGAKISMAAKGKPQENGYAERVIRTIKEEEVLISEYRDFADATEQIGHFIDVVYQRERIHSGLGYLTPAEFEAVCVEDPLTNSANPCPRF